MRGALLATAAAFVGSALADGVHMRRHGHDALHQRRALHGALSDAEATCGCTTKVITYYGEPTLVPVSSTPAPSSTVTSQLTTTLSSTSYTTVTVVVTPSPSSSEVASIQPVPETTPALPTNGISTFPSTGVFTIPASTLTVTQETTVPAPTTTALTSGSNTYGGVTTVVETATTVVCPYATVSPSGSTVTSVIQTTTYVCPSAGTYTIAPTTTFVSSSTVVVYPTPATLLPGTYTQPEQTVTVTETDFHYVCPFTSSGLPTSAPAPTAPAVSTSAAVQPTSSAPSVVVSTSSTPSSTSSVPPAATSSTGVSAGHGYGMTYSPYANDGGCKAKSDIFKEVAVIKQKGFSVLRVYSTDCSGLEWISEAAAQNGLNLILGVYISSTGVADAQEQVQAIASWAKWEMVELIVVGNEAIQNGWVDASTLAGFISSAKSTWQSAGYHGPVTTAETLNIWEADSSVLCSAVDIVGANIHPFFNSDVSPADAGKFAKGQIDILSGLCGGKDVLNLETGWPNSGDANGAAVPGFSQQVEAIHSLLEEVGTKSVFFSYSDDLWKSAGAFNVEQHWGCIDAF